MKCFTGDRSIRRLWVWLGLLFLLAIPFCFAESIGTYTQTTNVELYQTCNNCTYCNITDVKIKSPIKSTLINSSQSMTSRGTYYFYILNQGNTTKTGTYEYCYDCGNSNEKSVGCIEFSITSTGTELSTSQAIIYFIFLVASISLFVLCFYYAIKISWKNQRDEDNYVVGINDLKYLKLFLMCMSYILLLFISGLMRSITSNFLPEIGVYRLFEVMFWLLLAGVYPIIVLGFVFGLIIWVSDKKFQKALERGIPIK